MPLVTKSVTARQQENDAVLETDIPGQQIYDADMVTRIRKQAKPRLYIEEHIVAKGLSFETVGERLGVSRTTVWRWAREQWRLDPNKIAALAEAIGLDSWQDLGRYPHRQSVDGILANADQNTYEAVIDLAKKLTQRAS